MCKRFEFGSALSHLSLVKSNLNLETSRFPKLFDLDI